MSLVSYFHIVRAKGVAHKTNGLTTTIQKEYKPERKFKTTNLQMLHAWFD